MRGQSAQDLELKTLKLSREALKELRAPIIWNRPCSGLYDYHYDVAGLYYQPMISYCMDRERGGERKRVDMPERLQSNMDRVAYTRLPDDSDYEGFLTQMYQRRIKDKHSKQIYCGIKKWGRSKEPTKLNMVRDAATDRDKYLCQIQLYYTGRIAQDRVLGGKSSSAENSENTVTKTVTRRSGSGEDEEVVTEENRSSQAGDTSEFVKKDSRSSLYAGLEEEERKMDGRYGPGFAKTGQLNSRKLGMGRISALDVVGVAEPKLKGGLDDFAKLERRAVGEAKSQYSSYMKERKETDKFIEADTQDEFLKLEAKMIDERQRSSAREYKPLYFDTSYTKALKDVQRRVKGKGDQPLTNIEDINTHYRRRNIEDIGKYEKASIFSGIASNPHIPDFDIGYDTVERRMVCSK